MRIFSFSLFQNYDKMLLPLLKKKLDVQVKPPENFLQISEFFSFFLFAIEDVLKTHFLFIEFRIKFKESKEVGWLQRHRNWIYYIKVWNFSVSLGIYLSLMNEPRFLIRNEISFLTKKKILISYSSFRTKQK